MSAMIPANSVHLIGGGNVIKQGDETPLTFQLNDESGQPVDLAGATVTVRMANSQIVVLTKQVTVNDDNTVSFAITSDEATGHGEMRLEFVVNKDGKQEIFPAQGFQQITIQPSLGGLDSGYVAVITLEEFERRIDGAVNQATKATTDANTAAQRASKAAEEATDAADRANQITEEATEAADKANQAAQNATAEASNLSQLKTDVLSATDEANSAAGEATQAATNANTAAQNATTQANYAKQQGDYAKQQGDIAKGIIESGTVASVNGKTGAVVLGANDIGAIPVTEKGVAGGVAKLNEDGKVVDVSGNEVEGKVKSVNGQTGEVNILIPAKVSELVNDSGFATAKYVEDEVGEVSNELASHLAENLKKLKLKDTFQLERLFGFSTGDTSYKIIQGMTVTDKYIVVGVINGTDSDNTWLYIFDKNTYELATLPANPIKDRSFGHCNDMTFNPNTNQILIVGLTNQIYILDADTFATVSVKILPFNAIGIGYDEDLNQYVIDDGAFSVHILDADFNEISSFSTGDTGLTKQGLCTHEGLIYLTFFDRGESSSYQSSGNPDMAFSGQIWVYTHEGLLVKTYLLPNTLGLANGIYGEIQSISYYKNGKFLLNYNMWSASNNGEFFTIDLLPQTSHVKNDLIKVNSEIKGFENIIKINSDLNSYTIPGKYRGNGTGIASTLLNCPTDVNFKLFVEPLQNPKYIAQIILDRLGNIHTRVLDEYGIWGDWNSSFSPGNEPVVSSGDDLNSYDKPGVYRIDGTDLATTLLNCPTTLNGKLIVEYVNNIDFIMQTYKVRDNHVYTRTRGNTGVWSKWKLIPHVITGKARINITAINTVTKTMVDLTPYGLTSEPTVLITPYTGFPQTLYVSVTTVSPTSFEVVGYRTDAASPFDVYWMVVNNS